MDRILEMTAGGEWQGASLEKLLIREFHLTRRQISRLKFQPDALQVNGERSRVSGILRQGDCVRVILRTDNREERVLALRENGDLQPCAAGTEQAVGESSFPDTGILWNDEDILIVNKPPGISVHPAHGHRRDTLLWILEEKLYPDHGAETGKLYPTGRLDKDTSGLMVFAKHAVAAARLQRKGAVEKEYFALVYGCFPPEQQEFTIEYPLRRMSGYLNRMEAVREKNGEDAMPAITRGKVLRQWADRALVRLKPETGRTHQIRVHMSSIGHPLLGDPIYTPSSRPETGIGRAALHCAKLDMKHPITEEILRFTSPLPEDMRAEMGQGDGPLCPGK